MVASSTEGGIYTGKKVTSDPLAMFLVQLMLIILLTRGLHIVFKKFRQPLVIWEIIGGIILGPSVLGNINGWIPTLFPTSTLAFLSLFANFGLFFYLFLVGIEMDLGLMAKGFRRSAMISISGIVVPFCLGIAVAEPLYHKLYLTGSHNANTSFASFCVFIGVAMSITAFPVLTRILIDQKLLRTKLGTLLMGAAAVDDVVAWCLLALVIALLNSDVDKLAALWAFLTIAGYAAFLLVVFRPLYTKFVNFMLVLNNVFWKSILLAITFVFLFFSAWFTDIIGVHAVFGGFLMGLAVPRGKFALELVEKTEDFVMTVFLPLYFTYSGLKTDIGSMNSGTAWAMFFLVIAGAIAGKFGGCTLAAKCLGLKWRESVTIGTLMNTKGLVEIIVLNIGLSAGAINTQIFTIMVLMALVTTFITTPALHFVYPPRLRDADEAQEKAPAEDESDVELGDNMNLVKPVYSPTATKHFLSNAINAVIPIQDIDDLSAAASFLSFLDGRFRSVKLHALRLFQSSESVIKEAMMLRSEKAPVDTDALLRMFATCGHVVNAQVDGSIAVSDPEFFSREVISTSRRAECDLIVLPVYRDIASEFPSLHPVFSNASYKEFAEELVKTSNKTVAVFCDQTETLMPKLNREVSMSEQALLLNVKRITLLYSGGESSKKLLSIGSHMARSDRVKLTVINISDAKDDGDFVLESVKESVKDSSNVSYEVQSLDSALETLSHATGRSSAADLVMFTNDEWTDGFQLHEDQSKHDHSAVTVLLGNIGQRLFHANIPCAFLCVTSMRWP
eukprot:TRINITY_DN4070_c0_g2_i1.p1 TRINITY_DN4070_c0_g2~~TRINITY_DN4070_c0_g2_i1.p1  ORF type:complete len:788 (+),score=194.09 TRINITY_DN4070_c0_g2_i1:119-2482(+)